MGGRARHGGTPAAVRSSRRQRRGAYLDGRRIAAVLLLGRGLAGSLPALAEPLVHAGDAEEARVLAEELLGPSERQAVSLSSLRAKPAVLLSGSAVRPCEGEPGSLEDGIAALRAGILYAETDIAERAARAAMAAACHGADARQLAVISYLRGAHAAEQGAADEALLHFRDARRLDPELAWDDTFDPALRDSFDHAAETATMRVELTILPAIDARLDGAPPGPVPPGWHLARAGGVGAWVELPDASDTLVLPSAVPDSALDWVTVPEDRKALSSFLAATLGEGTSVSVVADGAVWTGVAGRPEFEEHRALEEASPLPKLLAGMGLTLAAAGGAMAAQAWATGQNEYQGGDETLLKRARGRYWLGWSAIAGGVAVGGTGIALTVVR